MIGYAALRKRLEAEGKPIIVLPQLQEANDLPCDTGSVRPRSNQPLYSVSSQPFRVSFDTAPLTPVFIRLALIIDSGR